MTKYYNWEKIPKNTLKLLHFTYPSLKDEDIKLFLEWNCPVYDDGSICLDAISYLKVIEEIVKLKKKNDLD